MSINSTQPEMVVSSGGAKYGSVQENEDAPLLAHTDAHGTNGNGNGNGNGTKAPLNGKEHKSTPDLELGASNTASIPTNGTKGAATSTSAGAGLSESSHLVNKHADEPTDWDILQGRTWESKYFYNPDWRSSFDIILMSFMGLWSVALLVATYYVHPVLLTNPGQYIRFWGFQTGKTVLMLFSAFCGGLVVIFYHVKANYTRKIQHFCAYLLPLAAMGHEQQGGRVVSESEVLLLQWWGYWFTLMSFAVFVYPIRTRLRVIDVMFASLDRPEDRPNTLYWITTQVFLGYIILSAFEYYCDVAGLSTLKALVFIPVFTTGIGDGMAEPVGVAWGRHKYKTRGFCSPKEYTRSYEGSFCVWIVCVISTAIFYNVFPNWLQFTLAIVIVPIMMTLAEAFSPHTWDTPFLLLTGCGLLWAITYVNI
jgi:dolichol kinase